MSTTAKTLGAIADEVLAIGPHDWYTGDSHEDGIVFARIARRQYEIGSFDSHDDARAAVICRTAAPALARGVKKLEASNEDLRERLRVAEELLRRILDETPDEVWLANDTDKHPPSSLRVDVQDALARIAAPVEVNR